jgi:hypothetical protein
MKFYKGVLSENLCDELFNLAKTVATSYGGIRIKTPNNPNGEALECWLNYGWEESLVQDSTPVFCIKVPEFLAEYIEEQLESFGVYDRSKYKSFKENHGLGCMLYVWTFNSYIASHHDSDRLSATIYLNREWSYEEGGHFTWQDSETNDWKLFIPKFNNMIVNTGGIAHATTPVKSKTQFRISLQLFFLPR